jgi:hypothetical protein
MSRIVWGTKVRFSHELYQIIDINYRLSEGKVSTIRHPAQTVQQQCSDQPTTMREPTTYSKSDQPEGAKYGKLILAPSADHSSLLTDRPSLPTDHP